MQNHASIFVNIMILHFQNCLLYFIGEGELLNYLPSSIARFFIRARIRAE